MVTLREARELAGSNDLSSELYWAMRVERKIRDRARDKHFTAEVRIFDDTFNDVVYVQQYVMNVLEVNGFKAELVDMPDHKLINISWEMQNVGSVPHGESVGGAGV